MTVVKKVLKSVKVLQYSPLSNNSSLNYGAKILFYIVPVIKADWLLGRKLGTLLKGLMYA